MKIHTVHLICRYGCWTFYFSSLTPLTMHKPFYQPKCLCCGTGTALKKQCCWEWEVSNHCNSSDRETALMATWSQDETVQTILWWSNKTGRNLLCKSSFPCIFTWEKLPCSQKFRFWPYLHILVGFPCFNVFLHSLSPLAQFLFKSSWIRWYQDFKVMAFFFIYRAALFYF